MSSLMRYILLFVFHLMALGVLAQQSRITSPVRFLALGDSYTIGQSVPIADRWPEQLVRRLKNQGVEIEELKIIAQTGWTTDDLEDAIAWNKPDSTYNLVSLLIGVNNQYQGKNIEDYPVEFRQLLETAITLCGGQKEGVFVLSIPDYGYTPFGSGSQQQISAEIDAYNQINRNIARELGIAYFDITPISREAISRLEYLAPDNLHPSGKMYTAWIDYMFATSGFNVLTTDVSGWNKKDEIKIYPNPVYDVLNFNAPDDAKEIRIYDKLGRTVYHSNTESLTRKSIEVSNWEQGVYFYRILQKDGAALSGKIIKM